MDTIEDIVRTHVPLVHSVSSKGWHSVFCEVCGDGSRAKGPRGGWLFQDDMCFYNCFNCGVEANFDPNREHPNSKYMYEVFTSFGVPYKEVQELLVKNLKGDKRQVIQKKAIRLPNIEQPDFFVTMTNFPEDNPFFIEAKNFLWDNYKMRPDDYPFMLSSGKTSSKDPDDIYHCKHLRTRIIIPAYQGDRLIYWQGRLFYGSGKKYLNASVEDSSAVIHCLEHLYDGDPDRPLYITEGFFDSWHLNGLAVLGNTMKDAKIQIISRSRKPKVVVPDYNSDGMHLANQAIELGWGISLPEIFPCRDICNAINHFGKLYVLKSVVDRTYHGFEAKIRLKDFQIKNQKFLSNIV
jgi:hypothetical protein